MSDVRQQPEEDWFLQNLVAWANLFGVETGITLTVGGATISGTLISGDKYFLEFGKLVADGAPEGDVRQEMGRIIEEHSQIYLDDKARANPASEPEARGDSDDPIPPPTFIHLKSARIYIGGLDHVPTTGGLLWRGKISAVEGFSIGLLSKGK